MILFRVHPKNTNIHIFTWAQGREQAKRQAETQLHGGWGGSDNWEVSPLSAPGDRVQFIAALSV